MEPHPDYSQDPFHMVLVRGISLPSESEHVCVVGCCSQTSRCLLVNQGIFNSVYCLIVAVFSPLV